MLVLLTGLAVPVATHGAPGPVTDPDARAGTLADALVCSAAPSTPPEYYAFELVTTKQIPGTGRAGGLGEVYFKPSPFGVSLAADGSYLYNLRLTVTGLRERRDGTYVAWITTPDLDEIRRIGPVGRDGVVEGEVGWNKFLVVVTIEPTGPVTAGGGDETPQQGVGTSRDTFADGWTGPIVMRGLSRSGLMHTMAGHGPLQGKGCATFGFT